MIRYAAPGRVNLIGEHTDYNLGLALPIATPEHTVACLTPDDGALVVRSDRADGTVVIPLDTSPGGVTGWAAYIAGVVWALRTRGYHVVGGEMSIESSVAVGSGLGSSAALECAALGAILEATGESLDLMDRARLVQAAENGYVGAPTGLLDQLASLFGQERTALLIDFRQMTVRPVPFDPDASGVALLLVDSHVRHRHAGGEYAARRASCERAAAAVGVASLRDARALDAISDPVDARRARHVLTENQRVLDFVQALGACDYERAGHLLTASHRSMRDDFQITTRQLDLIADTAVAAGALGARMTGGGFGGFVIALVPAENVGAVRRAVGDATRVQAGPGARSL